MKYRVYRPNFKDFVLLEGDCVVYTPKEGTRVYRHEALVATVPPTLMVVNEETVISLPEEDSCGGR
jgi:hypothetical protein